jgi:hypothetical protein
MNHTIHTVPELLFNGYQRGAPSPDALDIDAAIAERGRCTTCGGPMRYEGYHKEGSYIAFAVCCTCGRRVEF